jgi:competence protein ComEC
MSVVLLLGISFLLIGIWGVWSTSADLVFSTFILFILFFSLGIARVSVFDAHYTVYEIDAPKEVAFEGRVIREPDIRTSSVHLYVESIETKEVVLVSTDVFKPFSYGDVVYVRGDMTPPESFETDLGRVFKYPEYLRARGVVNVMWFADVKIRSQAETKYGMSILLDWKHVFMDSIEHIIPEPYVGLGEGLLLGVKRALGDDLEETFRKTGIIHIVVLSGYNVMLVAEGIMRLLSFFFSIKVRTILGVASIIAFACLVGLSSTVVRASIMAVLVLIARASGRMYLVLRALMFAGVLMLIHNPYLLLYDPGFQLSFVATLGLIFLIPILEDRVVVIPSRFQIKEFFLSTCTTQLFVLPLLLYSIGEFSIISVVVNILVLPAVPIAMLLTFITGIVGFVSTEFALLVGYGAYITLLYIIQIAEFFGSLSFATISVPAFPSYIMVLLYLLLGCVVYFIHRKESN